MPKIISEKNIFINNTTSYQQINNHKNLSGQNLCIYEMNGEKITDIECISGAQLKTALALPNFRKYEVCIGDACINDETARIMNGSMNFELKSLNPDLNFKDKCVGLDELDAHKCVLPDYASDPNNAKYNFKLQSLVPLDCDNYLKKTQTEQKWSKTGLKTYFKFDTEDGMDMSGIQSLMISKFDLPEIPNPFIPQMAEHTGEIDEMIRPDSYS